MENKTVSIAHKTLHYTIAGQGNTLTFIHGFMESSQIWEKFSESLSKEFKVICIDLPGHGQSDIFGDVHLIDLQARLIKMVLDAEKVYHTVLIGHSMGGYVCAAFAQQFPENTQGLGLFHSHVAADSEQTKAFRDRTIVLLNKNKTGFISQFIPDLFAEGNAEKFPTQIRQLTEGAQKMDKDAIIASQLGMRDRTSYLNVLVEASHPVLFIQGKRDTKSNLQKVIAQALLPKHSEILLIDSGHMGFIEEEQQTISFIQGFAQRAFLI
ncbi:MAG: alpha/beta hydrolase [Bacteroidales bacterium]